MRCRRLSKSLSSTFLKAVRNCEDEVAAKLKEGNPDDHVRHEEYVLSYLPEPLKNQVYSYV
jgi:singapore isolate B (sub-type 7) whole genome shotgun sequence assembly, scaffold_3